ncbi:MAG: hypothetical protein E7547_03400 [Ruminococcaceae bacterium]|nr:hypothetical protein [Oscillospiraceae bacterium]
MKKILAVLLAFAMLFAFAACGDNGDNETTTTTVADETTDAPVADETTAAPVTDETTAAADETTTAADETTAAGETTTAAGETTVANAEMSKADFVKFLNAETAKAAKGKYNFNRNCEYTSPIDVGSATGILNGIISAIDENSNLDTVVGGFLGIGTKKGAFPKDDLSDNYKIKATSLKESDLGSFSYANGVYKFTLANATNPKKTGATPLSRFTNDFITHEEVVEGIADFTNAITVNNTNVNYKNIKVEVTVADGKITNIKYSYAFDATLALKAVVTINGSGAAVTNATFSDIKY